MKSFVSICFSTLLFSLAGHVSADLNSGSVSFRGTITHDLCNINTVTTPVVIACHDPVSGKAIITSVDLTKPESLRVLPAEVKMRWNNPQKTTGVMYVSYF